MDLEKNVTNTMDGTICVDRVLTYFGHFAKRDGENLEKAIIIGKVSRVRGRGRLPMRWTDYNEERDADGARQKPLEREIFK